MSRRKRLNAVATTALVAAFPVFPLFADEPTAPDAASQTVVQTSEATNANDAFAEFNVALFEIPDDESVEFYRQRVDEIEREWNRLVLARAAKLEKLARQNGTPAPNQGRSLHAPIGTIYDGTRYVPAPAASIPARRAVALADLYRRLADAPELPLEVRGQYYVRWLGAASSSLQGKTAAEIRDFYAKLLADEKAKSPLDLGRVLYLRGVVSLSELNLLDDALSTPIRDRADVEKLLAEKTPGGESAEFYRQRRVALTRAATFVAQQTEKDEALENRLSEALANFSKLRSEALKAEAAAFDRDAVKQFFDVPVGENAAFYLERYQETEAVRNQLSSLSQNDEGKDLRQLEHRLRTETLPEIAKRLAYADELEPLERFEYLRRWLNFCDVEQLQTALDAEIARDTTSEIDACREAYVATRLAVKRLDAAVAETLKSLPERKRVISDSSDAPTVSPEARKMFDDVCSEIAELADDGAQPWTLGTSWSQWAAQLASQLQLKGYFEVATQLRKDVRDALADSENETDRQVVRDLEREIRSAEIIGSEIPIEGRLADGTSFNWASYRGAPVLVELARLDENDVPTDRNGYIPFADKILPQYEKAGLRRLTYLPDATLDAVRKFKEREEKHGALYAQPFVCPPENVASSDDWAFQNGFVWLSGYVLFDAEGRVLATSPRLPKGGPAPKIADELRRLFPDVSRRERK